MQIWVLNFNDKAVAFHNAPTAEEIIDVLSQHDVYEYPANLVSPATAGRLLSSGHAEFYGTSCILNKLTLKKSELLCNSQFNNYLSQGS